jgi:tetratricopeptide (TPR) repeat protein
MNHDEAILAELRKIAAWADMQRRVTRWSLAIGAVFILAMIVFAIVTVKRAESQMEGGIRDYTKTEYWSNVDGNVVDGNFDDAIRIGEKLIRTTPEDPNKHRQLAFAYLAAGKMEQAKEHYAEAFRLFPSEENEKSLNAITKRIERDSTRATRSKPTQLEAKKKPKK